MSIFSKSSIGQFSTNYSQSYHEPGKESYLASNHVSYHPKPNASLTDPNRNFGLDGGVDSLYKSSFVGGGKEEWFSQLPAFRPVHAAAGTSGPFCGSSTARDSYLNSGNNAELHKKNSIDAKVNKNRGKVAQTNPRPYVSDACRVAIRPITFYFHVHRFSPGTALWRQVFTSKLLCPIPKKQLRARFPAEPGGH